MRIRYGVIASIFLALVLAAPARSQHKKVDPELLLRHHTQFQTPHVSTTSAHESRLPRRSATTEFLAVNSTDAILAWLLMQQLSQTWDVDANAWVDETRLTYTRNDAGYITSQLVEDWDVDAQEWVNAVRITDALDDQNRTVESIWEGWDPEANSGAGDWVPTQRSNFTYNAQGKTLVTSSEIWMEDSGEYMLFYRTTSTYDGAGERELVRLFESALFGDIQPSSRQTFTYDGSGNVTQELNETYFAGTWVNSQLLHFSFDDNGQIEEEITQTWDLTANGGTGGWVNNTQILTTYAPNSNDPTEITETELLWDTEANGGAGAWVNSTRWIDSISATETIYTEQVWMDGEWVNEYRSITTINSQGSFDEYIEQVWDSNSDEWVNEARTAVEYDDEGNLTVFLGQVWMDGEWVNESRLIMTYENFDPTASENETPGQRFDLGSNYPNPFTDETVISYSLAAPDHITIEVFDVLGRRVGILLDAVAPAGNHTVKFESGELADGLYVYRLRGTSIQKSRTMLLVR